MCTLHEMSMMNALNPVDEFIQIGMYYRETDRLEKMCKGRKKCVYAHPPHQEVQ